MAKGRGILLAGLAAGAYAYFKKPENREKATVAFNNAKTKVNSFMESQNLDNDTKNQQEKAQSEETKENEMVSEGAMTSVQYRNEDVQESEDNSKLSSNDTGRDKAENTKTVAPENKINTNNL